MEEYGSYFNKLPKIAQLKTLQFLEKEKGYVFNLDSTVHTLAKHWELTLGKVLNGGTASLIIEVIRANGQAAILKIALPGNSIFSEAMMLKATQGNGYAKLYEVDLGKEALLLEKLGTPLSGTSKTIEEHIVILCKVLTEAWIQPKMPISVPNTMHKALEMKYIIQLKWKELNQPFSQQTLDLALEYAQARMDAFDPKNAVLLHGDAHGFNILETENGDYKFVDPDGVFGNKAYDLICMMRDWSEVLLHGNPLELLLKRCQWLHELTGVDTVSIWQWGFIGRLMIGITLLELGDADRGKRTLEVADKISHYRGFS